MNFSQLQDERRQQVVQDMLYNDLFLDLSAKIDYHFDVETSQVLLQGPIFVGLRKHTGALPSDKTLGSFHNFNHRGYRVLVAKRGEVNGPGVHFTLHKPQSAA